MTFKYGFLTATDEKTCFIVFSFSVNPTTEKIFFLSFIRERTKTRRRKLLYLNKSPCLYWVSSNQNKSVLNWFFDEKVGLSISVWTTLIAERLSFYWTSVSMVGICQKCVAFIKLHVLCYPFSRSRTNGKLNVVHQRTLQSFKMHKMGTFINEIILYWWKQYYLQDYIAKVSYQLHENYSYSYSYIIIHLIFQQFRWMNQKKYCKSRLECEIHTKNVYMLFI